MFMKRKLRPSVSLSIFLILTGLDPIALGQSSSPNSLPANHKFNERAVKACKDLEGKYPKFSVVPFFSGMAPYRRTSFESFALPSGLVYKLVLVRNKADYPQSKGVRVSAPEFLDDKDENVEFKAKDFDNLKQSMMVVEASEIDLAQASVLSYVGFVLDNKWDKTKFPDGQEAKAVEPLYGCAVTQKASANNNDQPANLPSLSPEMRAVVPACEELKKSSSFKPDPNTSLIPIAKIDAKFDSEDFSIRDQDNPKKSLRKIYAVLSPDEKNQHNPSDYQARINGVSVDGASVQLSSQPLLKASSPFAELSLNYPIALFKSFRVNAEGWVNGGVVPFVLCGIIENAPLGNNPPPKDEPTPGGQGPGSGGGGPGGGLPPFPGQPGQPGNPGSQPPPQNPPPGSNPQGPGTGFPTQFPPLISNPVAPYSGVPSSVDVFELQQLIPLIVDGTPNQTEVSLTQNQFANNTFLSKPYRIKGLRLEVTSGSIALTGAALTYGENFTSVTYPHINQAANLRLSADPLENLPSAVELPLAYPAMINSVVIRAGSVGFGAVAKYRVFVIAVSSGGMPGAIPLTDTSADIIVNRDFIRRDFSLPIGETVKQIDLKVSSGVVKINQISYYDELNREVVLWPSIYNTVISYQSASQLNDLTLLDTTSSPGQQRGAVLVGPDRLANFGPKAISQIQIPTNKVKMKSLKINFVSDFLFSNLRTSNFYVGVKMIPPLPKKGPMDCDLPPGLNLNGLSLKVDDSTTSEEQSGLDFVQHQDLVFMVDQGTQNLMQFKGVCPNSNDPDNSLVEYYRRRFPVICYSRNLRIAMDTMYDTEEEARARGAPLFYRKGPFYTRAGSCAQAKCNLPTGQKVNIGYSEDRSTNANIEGPTPIQCADRQVGVKAKPIYVALQKHVCTLQGNNAVMIPQGQAFAGPTMVRDNCPPARNCTLPNGQSMASKAPAVEIAQTSEQSKACDFDASIVQKLVYEYKESFTCFDGQPASSEVPLSRKLIGATPANCPAAKNCTKNAVTILHGKTHSGSVSLPDQVVQCPLYPEQAKTIKKSQRVDYACFNGNITESNAGNPITSEEGSCPAVYKCKTLAGAEVEHGSFDNRPATGDDSLVEEKVCAFKNPVNGVSYPDKEQRSFYKLRKHSCDGKSGNWVLAQALDSNFLKGTEIPNPNSPRCKAKASDCDGGIAHGAEKTVSVSLAPNAQVNLLPCTTLSSVAGQRK